MTGMNMGEPEGSRRGAPAFSIKRVMTILNKEFREVFRDRRTILSVVVSPLVITPALFALVGLVIGHEASKEKERIYDVGLVGAAASPTLARAIERLSSLRVHELSRDRAEQEVQTKRLTAVVVVPPAADELAAKFTPVSIQILMDAGDESSQSASQRLSHGLSEIGSTVVSQRLSEKHLAPDFAKPYVVTESPIKKGGSLASLALAALLPYLLVISSFGGAIYAAFDQVAGEKERGTLETLLVSPASRREIVLGKFGAVAMVCLLSSALAVIGVIISFVLPGSALAIMSKGGLHLSGAAILVSMLVMMPLAVLFAGLLIAVSTFARNQKEAQTYITPILLLVMVPVLVSVFVRADVPRYMSLVPILGTSIIIKQAFGSIYDPAFILLAFGSSVVYGGLALLIATKLFENEAVLSKA